MKNNGQTQLLNHIVSPYGLAIISYAFFLLSCLIPPSVYEYYMHEPDLMFLDPATILFYTLCVACFILGAWFIGWLFPSTFVERTYITRIPTLLFLLTPLLAGIVAVTIVNVYLILHFPTILVSLMAKQGSDIKNTLIYDNDTSSRIIFAPIMLIGTIWWAFWRISNIRLGGWRKKIVQCAIFFALMSVIIYSVLVVFRAITILAICGLAVLYILHKTIRQEASLRSIFRICVAFVIFIPLLFISFSFLRGANNWDDQISSLMGYTVASYNRLAAVVNGNLHYPFAGRGAYLSGAIVHTRMLPLNEILNPPDPLDIWGSEFAAVSQAGLDGELIWSGAFGYIFSDIGWFSLLFLFGYGILYAFVWRQLKCGKIIGVLLYPCFGACILLWLGLNYVLEQPTEVLLLTTAVLAAYERLFVNHSKITRHTV